MIKKLNILLSFLLFFIAVALTSGCSPIGSLLVEPSVVRLDYIRVVPKRFLYSDQEPFVPVNEMKLFGVFSGEEEPIPIDDKVEIKIIYNPDETGGSVEVPVPNEGIGFSVISDGRLKIDISYLEMNTYYFIQVGNPDDGTGSGSGWPNGPTGIKIEWN